MYVLERTDQGGGYVAKPGRKHSYTHELQHAQTFYTKEEAEKNSCVKNEIVVDLDDIVGKGY